MRGEAAGAGEAGSLPEGDGPFFAGGEGETAAMEAEGLGVERGVPGRGYLALRSDGMETIGSSWEPGSVARRLSFSGGVGDSS